MKKLLLGILLLSSFSAFANANPIINKVQIVQVNSGGSYQTGKEFIFREGFEGTASILVNCIGAGQRQQPSHTYIITLEPNEAVQVDNVVYICNAI
jgi:hypothetical protein